jgi:hypothetical protein
MLQPIRVPWPRPRPTDSLIDYLQARSVRLGNVWVPGAEVEQALARFCKLLLCLNKIPEAPYTLRGSATGVRLGREFRLFCCQHQFKGYDYGDVVISVDKMATTLVSGSEARWPRPAPENDGEEFLDVCSMRFEPERYSEPSLERGFFPIIEADCWDRSSDAHLFVYGYPSDFYEVDYAALHIDVKQIVTSATVVGSSNAQGVMQLRMTRTTPFPADGLSGGPVFHLSRDRAGFYVGLAGIVLRGSETSDYLHMLDVRYLRRFFD